MRCKVVLTAVLSVMLGVSSAYAESFVIRPDGGTAQLVLDFEGDFFRFAGQDFSVRSDGQENVGRFFPRVDAPSCGEVCRAGDTLDTSFHTPGEVLIGAGSATFGGVSFSDLTLHGTLAFDVTPIVFPSTNAENFFYQSLFSFEGFLRGMTAAGDQVFAENFTGVGHVLRVFDARPDGAYVGGENHIVYQFDAPTSPTPEPATALLVITGLVPFALRAHRGRKNA
jgi:hypothetical protein